MHLINIWIDLLVSDEIRAATTIYVGQLLMWHCRFFQWTGVLLMWFNRRPLLEPIFNTQMKMLLHDLQI